MQNIKTFLIYFLLISIFLSCNKQINKFTYNKDNLYRITVLASYNYTKFCIVPYSINTNSQVKSCIKNDTSNEYLCTTVLTENPLFKMSVRESADIIIKGISEIQLKNPNIGRNIKKVVVVSVENEAIIGETPVSKSFSKELEDILLKNKIPAIVKKLEKEEITSVFKESATKDFPSNTNDFLYLYTGENIFHLIKFQDSKPVNVFREDLATNQIFSEGEKYRKEFFYCRQPISEFFQNIHSGWENFEDCRSYIKDRFIESKNFKKLEEIKDSNIKFYAIGSVWSEIGTYFKSNTISRDQIKNSVRQNCKESTINLLNKKYSKEISYKLCFSLSYIDTILNILNLSEVEIVRENNLTDSLALFSGFFPECIVPPTLPEKKK